ncbi:MAG: glycosyltransferase family 9 protein [Terriglobia bacterium]
MTNVVDRLPIGSHVVVIRLRALGDCVLSTPAIHLLKQYRPDLQIAVVSEPAMAPVYHGNPDLSAVLPPAIAAVRGFHPELCINYHGGVRTARLTLLSGASTRAGYDMLRFQSIYNAAIPTAQRILGIDRQVHTAEHMASAMFFLGVPVSEVPHTSIYPPSGRSDLVPAGPYAVIHPLASRTDKTWPSDRYRALAESLDVEPVFIGVPTEDLSPFSEWRTLTGTPLTEVERIIRDADLFVGNDSGPAHIAAAVGTPAVVLFGPSCPGIWGPWRAKAEVVQADGVMTSITVAAVLHAVGKVLS